MPGSKAATLYGRQGGRWLPPAAPTQVAHRVDVPFTGGPYDRLVLPLHSWGRTATLPEQVPVAGGCYTLDDDGYQWTATRELAA